MFSSNTVLMFLEWVGKIFSIQIFIYKLPIETFVMIA